MQDLGEFLERLGRQIGRMEHHQGGGNWRFGEHFEQFRAHFGDGTDADVDETEPETDSRELHFGEQPELRLKVNLSGVSIRQVEAGGTARVSARGRDLSNVEIATAEDGAIDVKASRGYVGGSQRLYVYVPAGTRIRASADLGTLSASGLTDVEMELRSDAGRLRVRNCQGRMRLSTNAGRLDVQDCSGTLDAQANAGKIQVRDFTGVITARAEAGSIRCSGLRLEAGEHRLEASMGSVDATLVPNVPVHIETRTNLGSIHNRAGQGPVDAPAHLRLSTELGSIRVRFEEGVPTPLRRVSFTDERVNGGNGAATQPSHDQAPAGQPVDMQPVPLNDEADGTAAAPTTPTATETLRILGMVERHEISAGEGATLLAALRR